MEKSPRRRDRRDHYDVDTPTPTKKKKGDEGVKPGRLLTGKYTVWCQFIFSDGTKEEFHGREISLENKEFRAVVARRDAPSKWCRRFWVDESQPFEEQRSLTDKELVRLASRFGTFDGANDAERAEAVSDAKPSWKSEYVFVDDHGNIITEGEYWIAADPKVTPIFPED